MKNHPVVLFLTIITLSIVLMGCPYSSSVPLSAAPTKGSEFLMGTWEQATDGEVTVAIKSVGNQQLEITKTTKNTDSDPTIETYNGYVTEINGTIFLNVKEQSSFDESSTWYFYKIEREGDFKMTAFEVTSNIRETFDNSEEMKKFFTSNMQNSYFYNTDEVKYFKVK
jgi:hypothetical protein